MRAVGRRRVRVRVASVLCALVVVAAACEVPDPGPGDTLPPDHSIPPCAPPDVVPPGCLPAPATFVYDGSGDPESVRRLDVYQPPDSFAGPRPLLVYVHGGAWIFGSKEEPTCRADVPVRDRRCFPLTELDRGYVVASVDYRLHDLHTGANTFPAPVEDVKLALKWLVDNAADPAVDIDPARIVVIGSSAGGQIAALAVLTPGEWEPEPGYTTTVTAFVALIGPADLESWTAWLETQALGERFLAYFTRSAMGCPDPTNPDPSEECRQLLRRASPLHYVDASDPVGYFICGEIDFQVPCAVEDDPAYQGPTAFYRALLAARGGAFNDAWLDAHASVNMPDNTHNPDWDLNLSYARSFLDATTAPGSG